MTIYEMEGFLRGKRLSGDIKVNESNAQYLVCKLSKLQSQDTDMVVRLANAESRCRELVAENLGLKAAFDKPRTYLSWHTIPPTWEEPFPCGEYLGVHDETGHKNSNGINYWPVFAKPEIGTPATGVFLAEVRTQGVEMFALMSAEKAIKDNSITAGWKARVSGAVSEYAELLREGVNEWVSSPISIPV